MCVGFQIWVLVGLDACTNCNKNKLAYVVKSMKYKDRRMKYQSEICFKKYIYQSEIISELLPQITIHHIIYICVQILESYSISFLMTAILQSITLIMITMTQMRILMKNSIKKEMDKTNSIQHLLKIKICRPYLNLSVTLSITNEAHITVMSTKIACEKGKTKPYIHTYIHTYIFILYLSVLLRFYLSLIMRMQVHIYNGYERDCKGQGINLVAKFLPLINRVDCKQAAYLDNEEWQEILSTLWNQGGWHPCENEQRKEIYLFNRIDGLCNVNWPRSHSYLIFLYLLSQLSYVTTCVFETQVSKTPILHIVTRVLETRVPKVIT